MYSSFEERTHHAYNTVLRATELASFIGGWKQRPAWWNWNYGWFCRGSDNVLLTFFTRCWWRSTPKRRMNLRAEEERAWISYRLTSICFASSWKYLSLLQKPWRSTCEPAKVDEQWEGKRGGEVRMIACLQWVAKSWRNKFKFKLDTEVRTQANVSVTKSLRLLPPANCRRAGSFSKYRQVKKWIGRDRVTSSCVPWWVQVDLGLTWTTRALLTHTLID